jgi:hypothetical protein
MRFQDAEASKEGDEDSEAYESEVDDAEVTSGFVREAMLAPLNGTPVYHVCSTFQHDSGPIELSSTLPQEGHYPHREEQQEEAQDPGASEGMVFAKTQTVEEEDEDDDNDNDILVLEEVKAEPEHTRSIVNLANDENSPSASHPSDGWECTRLARHATLLRFSPEVGCRCTFQNSGSMRTCDICGARAPANGVSRKRRHAHCLTSTDTLLQLPDCTTSTQSHKRHRSRPLEASPSTEQELRDLGNDFVL